MARKMGDAIVIDGLAGGLIGEGDWLDDAKRLADAARSLNGASRRIGGQLRATAAGYISAVSKSVRAVEELRDEQLRAFGNTAAAWEEARTRMNGLSASLGTLKRSMRDAFVPMVTAAAPALTTLTNLLARAVNSVGSFMAALTGQDAFIRATGDQRAYAGSLKRSTGAARALKRQLASFDELDILMDRKDTSGGSGGLGGALRELSGQLALLPVDEGILRFAKQLKALFEAGNYEGVGRAIALGLNSAIEKARALIRWENVGAGVTKVIDGICAAFNALVDGIRWKDVGGALGDGIDTLLRSANRLLTGINFAGLGAALGQALNGAVAEIDFGVLGDTLARLLTAKLVVLANAVGTFDWKQFGGKLAEGMGRLVRTLGETLSEIDWSDLALKLAEGVNRFIGEMDWAAVGAFAGERLSDALGALRTAVTTFDWGSAGHALSVAVNNLVKKVDWEALGQWLDRTIKGVLDFGIRFLQGFDSDALFEGLGKALDEVDWDGIASKLWTLLREAVGKLGGIGGLLGSLNLGGKKPVQANVNVKLLKDGWKSVGDFVGEAVNVHTGLLKDGWSSLEQFVGNSLTVHTGLVKSGWSTLEKFVGDFLSVKTALERLGWSTISGFVGDSVTVRTGLVRNGWSSVQDFVGDRVSVWTELMKWGWTSLESFVGTDLTVWTQLARWGWYSLENFVGTDLTVWTQLARWGWSSLQDYVGTSVQAKVQLVVDKANEVTAKIASVLKLGMGGAITAAGRMLRFAGGGVVRGGMARALSGAPHYAGGTARAHGTVFVAGEAGPEVVGHINGRTEILNRSQIAQAIYSAVVSGMGLAVNALGRYLAGHMTNCANAIVATIGNVGGLAAMGRVEYAVPAMASGAVTPYEASARLARSNEQLQGTLDANNEDLIQTIISVIGAQTSALVAAIQSSGRGGDGGLTAEQIIGEINRRTQMFSASPLTGV